MKRKNGNLTINMQLDSFHDPVYGVTVWIMLVEGDSPEEVVKTVEKNIKVRFQTVKKNTWAAMCYSNTNKSLYCLAFKKEKNLAKLVGRITHETNHLLSYIFRSRGIKLATKSGKHEPQCYYQQFLAEETTKILQDFETFKK